MGEGVMIIMGVQRERGEAYGLVEPSFSFGVWGVGGVCVETVGVRR